MDRAFVLLAISALFIVQSSASGYDSSGSCNPRSSRRGRAQLLAAIPCDLTVQAYCNLPGAAYPWNAVRRFVHENQGLMKRMYGDTRHISVLKSEFEKNEIDVDDIELAAARYSPNGKHREERKSKYAGGRLNDVLTEPHFRPTTTSSTSATTTVVSTTVPNTATNRETPVENSTEAADTRRNPFESQERSSTMSYTDEIENLKNKYEILLEGDSDTGDDYKTRDESVETNSIFENTTEGSPPVSYNQQKLSEPQSSLENVDLNERQQISSTLKIIKVEGGFETTTTRKKNTTNDTDTTESSIHRNVEPIDDLGDKIISETEGNSYRETSNRPTSRDQVKPNATTTINSGQSTKKVLPLDRVDEFSAESSEIYTETNSGSTTGGTRFGGDKLKTTLTQTVQQQQPSQQPSQTMMEGHLYQDAVQKNNPPIMTGRGVNACPVKEEVVAPFWANNTRGEVLALLNLYPFEQYVHWEKCTNEHKQMYCREGCRCEQQYRLHRLLAYDPHNECRGIFSDWFRFPSCCICKCYDIPNEFRVTSRSPRSPREAPSSMSSSSSSSSSSFSTVEEAEQNLHQAIYAHATEDWYRVKRDDIEDLDDAQEELLMDDDNVFETN